MCLLLRVNSQKVQVGLAVINYTIVCVCVCVCEILHTCRGPPLGLAKQMGVNTAAVESAAGAAMIHTAHRKRVRQCIKELR